MDTSSLIIDTSSLIVRPNTSDSASFRQIFTEEELGPIKLPSDALILDCGAYVGYSSFYLLSKFPSSRVLAVEPDLDNYLALYYNLSEFLGTAGRAEALCGAVWSEDCSLLTPSTRPFRDGREWSKTFELWDPKPSDDVFGDVPPFRVGFSVAVLLNHLSAPSRPIDLLKMDIEGAETVIFSPSASNDLSWLDRISTIAIELHDDSPFGPATPVFLSAVKDRGFNLSRSGELTIARHSQRSRH